MEYLLLKFFPFSPPFFGKRKAWRKKTSVVPPFPLSADFFFCIVFTSWQHLIAFYKKQMDKKPSMEIHFSFLTNKNEPRQLFNVRRGLYCLR